MKIDVDRFREILDTLSRNKSRSFLTGFGVFWGIFMLLGLMGGGKGLEQFLSNNFAGFATNTGVIWCNPTSKAYDGFKKGRSWSLTYKDVDRLKQQVPELDVVTPQVSQSGTQAVFGDKKSSCNLTGLLPEYAKIDQPKLRYGRYINDMDIAQSRKVCVLAEKLYNNLFPGGGDPCGQRVRVDSTYYSVVGVRSGSSNISFTGDSDANITVPINVLQRIYNLGDIVYVIAVTGRKGVKISSISQQMRTVIARAHYVDPTDDLSIQVFNTEVMFNMMDSLFTGLNFLIWLVGIGTLLAGAIGVSNIMMVTVKERTTEIGIRRAIGATPRNILSQIISESVILTAVAGMSGVLFAVIILQLFEMGNTTDGVVTTHLQVTFWMAVGAVALLSVLGALAGLAPAYRAMSIKPVDAMRDE